MNENTTTSKMVMLVEAFHAESGHPGRAHACYKPTCARLWQISDRILSGIIASARA
jgi:hypothetical protein